ncbi:MAG: HAD family phosphatase [Lachnospiraceae bacterium]|nr:HAD family phosphatase [Lachnospiraceae bacterium]
MIKHMIFDVGMVLADFSWEKLFHRLGIQGRDFEKVADATVRSSVWDEYDRSRLGDEEVLNRFIANDPEQEKNIRLFWENVGDSISCYPYAEAWVKSFREKGYGCYVLSNYPRRTYELTKEKLAFEKHMNGLLYSFEVQQVKPEPEIFRTLFTRFDLRAEECVFMDDNPKNVEAASRLGIHAIRFTAKEEAERELRELGV